ncbi:50S ribosomal protein L33 [Mycoplasmopsis primatum]|nr:50S ribosomal protein L33 [Mycoplasmopsis primatum]
MFKRKVTLSCELCHNLNYGTHKSTTSIERIIIKKYCSKCNQHTVHKEEK